MVANQACHSRVICRISDALSTTPAVTSVSAASTSAATCRHSPDAGRLLLPSRTTKDQQAQNHCFRVGRRRRGGGFRRDPHRNRRRGRQHGLHGTDLQGHTHHQPGRPADLSAENVSVNVTSPTDVEIGEEFTTTYSIDPVSVEVPSLPLGARLETASRLKLDFALPDGVTFVGSNIDESNANLNGLHVLQVNEAGYPDENGRILRLTSADNATIGNGPNSSRNSHGGIRYDITGSHIDLRFPVIQLNLRADTEGDKHFGVRTAGAAGNFGADENFLTRTSK